MEIKTKIILAGLLAFVTLVTLIIVATRQPREEVGPVTIKIWRTSDDESVFQSIFENYLDDHPTVTIKYEKQSPADYEEAMVRAIEGGYGPDIWSLPNESVAKRRDLLAAAPADLTPQQVKQKFVNVVAEDVVSQGQVWGLPLFVDSLALYYNRELMLAALARLKKTNPDAQWTEESRLLTRPPTNWDDLAAAVKLLTQKNGQDVSLAGIAMGTADNTRAAAAILQALMLQNGAAMNNLDKSAASFHLPQLDQGGKSFYPGTEALDFYTAFARQDRAVYNWNAALGASRDAFAAGKAAMMIDFQAAAADIKLKAPDLFYDVVPLPQQKNTAQPANVASYMVETVTKTSTHPDIAWGLVRYMAERGASTYLSQTKRTSALRANNEGDNEAFPTGARIAKGIYKADLSKYDGYFRDMIKAVLELNQPAQKGVEDAAAKVTQLFATKK